MTVALPQSPGAGREESGALWAYAAMLAAMLISSGNFLLANLAVQEIDPVTLAFWRNATACFAPFAARAASNLVKYFRPQKVRLLVLAVTGVILPAWLMYLSLRSDDLINLSVGYTFIPLMTILFSALLLAERPAPVQYLGLVAASLGTLIFAFQGDLENLASFDPHEAFLCILAVCVIRSFTWCY